MTDLINPALEAVKNALQADAALQSVLGNPLRLYDQRPAMAVFPYLVIGGVEIRSAGAKNFQAQTLLLTLEVFSRLRDSIEVRTILARIYNSLQDASLSPGSGAIVRCQEDLAAVSYEEESQSSHGVARYRLLLSV